MSEDKTKDAGYDREQNDSKGVYLAVLNQGNIAVELSYALTEMTHQQKYRLFVTYPAAKPIAENRNRIIEDFLSKKEFDYLLMIDSDIVPPTKILDMLDHLADDDKDIIAPLMFAYMDGAIIPLVLQEYSEEEKKDHTGDYHVMELEGSEGVVEVDAIGSGCMGITRRVLEDLEDEQPFCNMYNEKGHKILGLDISFCRKARVKGYKVWAHLDFVCSHWARMDLKMLYKSISQKYEIERKDIRGDAETVKEATH